MYAKRLEGPGRVDLSGIDPEQDGGLSKSEGEARLDELGKELEDLQELLYGAGQHALLIVFQGRDTSGKDGVINKVVGTMNTVGCSVASFKVPTPVELGHDFLWRIHKETPEKGHVAVFNRSHYESVLIERVHKLVPEKTWQRRYAHINHFEENLYDADTIVVKFYLHISKEEQEKRLLAREEKAEKAWKLSPGDWKERTFWDDYTGAYEDALGKCAAPHAPWFVVPADRKWFRDVAVAEALVETLRPFRKGWEARLGEVGAAQKEALRAMRGG